MGSALTAATNTHPKLHWKKFAAQPVRNGLANDFCGKAPEDVTDSYRANAAILLLKGEDGCRKKKASRVMR